MSEPVCTEINVSYSSGGKVAIIKYDVSQDYHVSGSRRYSIPADWTEEQIEEFEIQKFDELKALVEPQAKTEFDDLWEQSYLNK